MGFAGTPPFAAIALAAVVDAGFAVKLVLTQPDRPQGRGLKLIPSAVKTLALERALPLWQPDSLKAEPLPAAVAGLKLDVLIVAAYGLILPPGILRWPTFGCINIHASLLPRWRGAAPIQRALLAGDKESGISIMQMDEGLDTGPVVGTYPVEIAPRETTGTLTGKLATAGAEAIVRTLRALQINGRLTATAQAASGASYAAKIRRSDAMIEWGDDAGAIDRRVRALDPAPGATAVLPGESVKIWVAEVAPGSFGTPGVIVRADASGVLVACGHGALLVRELQRAGGKRLTAAAFLAGRPSGWPARSSMNSD